MNTLKLQSMIWQQFVILKHLKLCSANENDKERVKEKGVILKNRAACYLKLVSICLIFYSLPKCLVDFSIDTCALVGLVINILLMTWL